MTWKLFIDDERNPVGQGWVIARSSEEAIQAVTTAGSLPSEIAFDHDLGGDDTSMRFLTWMSVEVLDGVYTIPHDFVWSVHSQNPVGAANIRGFIGNLVAFQRACDRG